MVLAWPVTGLTDQSVSGAAVCSWSPFAMYGTWQSQVPAAGPNPKPVDTVHTFPPLFSKTNIHSFKEKPMGCAIYPQYIPSNTSACFGSIYSPSSGSTPYGYNSWYLLYFLDDCLLSWPNSHLKSTISTNCCIQKVYLQRRAIDTPETCRGVWLNILKINCASSWFFFKWIYQDAQSAKHNIHIANLVSLQVFQDVSSFPVFWPVVMYRV